MIRLKNRYQGKAALIIMGGPSIIENNFDLSLIDKDRYTIFLEARALTPRFLEYGLIPDFYLMFFPEKCHANSLQHAIYQSFLMDINLERLLKPEYLDEYRHLKDNFANYFEVWNPSKGPHKRYKYKDHVTLNNSPFSLLPKLSKMTLLTRFSSIGRFPHLDKLKNGIFIYFDKRRGETFNLEEYFNPEEVDGRVMLNGYGHLNSAAIVLFPILNYLGFKKIYFLGMDMSMLGSMEYSSLYTFKSLGHFKKFYKKARPAFNYCFKENRRLFMRPPYEFQDLKQILAYERMEFINIYQPFKFALPLEGIKNISFREFLNE